MKKIGYGLVIGVVVLIVAGYLGGAYFFSSIVIDSPTQSVAAGEERMREILGELNLPAPQEVSIPAGAVTLAGNYYVHEGAGQCAVVLLHGHTGTRYGALQYAPLFWERGCDLLAYDARGHGDSTDAYHTYGYHEKEDAQVAFSWLQNQTGLPAEQMALTGVSYGAATALQTAPLLPDTLAFIIADSSYQDVRSIVTHQANERYAGWINLFIPGAIFFAQQRADFESDDTSPQLAVAQTTIPILIVHALEDSYTPYTHAVAIFENSAPETTELEITDWGAEHGQSIIVDFAAFAQMTDAFMDEYAPGFGAE